MSNQYCCPKCNIIFKYPSLLKTHFRKVYHCLLSEEEIEKFFITYNCLLCKKKFKNIKSLKRHCKETICGKTQTLHPTTNTSNEPINIIINTNTNTNISNQIDTSITNNNDIIKFNYVYLIEKFDVNTKEYIYKFGKTNRQCSKRLQEHGNEAKILFILDVDDCNKVEKKILNILNNCENIRKCSFGNEYFICNDKEYIKNIILKNIYNVD